MQHRVLDGVVGEIVMKLLIHYLKNEKKKKNNCKVVGEIAKTVQRAWLTRTLS
jgi:hypothetical protein